ncbi:MAG: septum formation protein Maf [Clostridia bacterium]|nr:septum formation protein Maf [Clostridia bacterium]
MKTRIVLASSSPRRAELLRMFDLPFEIVPPDLTEAGFYVSVPRALASVLAVGKAQIVAEEYPISIIISADTVVELDGQDLGKPRNANDARRILSRLSGRTHTVHTGLAVIYMGEMLRDVVSTKVTFRELSEEEIEAYIASGEPEDKAGAYAIQGRASAFVEKIEGDYFAVVGLPIAKLREFLKQFDIDMVCGMKAE